MTDSDRTDTLLHGDQRVAVLADAQNLYHTAQSLYSRNIDYESLLDEAVGGRELVRAIAYVIRADSPEEERFFEALVDIGFETRIKRIKTFGDGTKKADWDVGMSLDAVTLAEHVDSVVLCTGDGDFSRLCSHLRHEGVRVEVLCFRDSTADELIDAADSFLDLSEREDRFLL
ncbi:MAG: NYN domain-containing protein [Haloferacaceae archaeon]